MSRTLRLLRLALPLALLPMMQAGLHAQALAPAAAGAAPYCGELKRVVALAAAREKFASIAGNAREGSFLDTSLPLTDWRDCSLYGLRTYTCDSREFETSDAAETALARIAKEIKSCLGEGWIEDESRSSPAYLALQNAHGAASMTLSTDLTDRKQFVVRLILFLRGGQARN
jgi:hypothetical protein